MKHVTLVASTVLLSLVMAGPSAAATLYERLGGEPALSEIAGTLIDRVAADPVLGRSFRDSNLRRIKKNLSDQLCELTGGPCHYTGDNMRDVHAGHDITEAEFNRMVECLEDILRSRHVALADRNRLLAMLAPMKRDVVRVPPGP